VEWGVPEWGSVCMIMLPSFSHPSSRDELSPPGEQPLGCDGIVSLVHERPTYTVLYLQVLYSSCRSPMVPLEHPKKKWVDSSDTKSGDCALSEDRQRSSKLHKRTTAPAMGIYHRVR